MRLKISAEPEINALSPVVISESIIDMNQAGAICTAKDLINAIRYGMNIYERVSATDVLIAQQKKKSKLIGVSLEWIK
ncbi:MAG: hypothetical protein VYC55_07935 [Pseudomonadota bacterium]|nr:hypothetical protein [Pseudomonadota bacterium]